MQARSELGQVEHLALAQLRVGEPGQVGDGELPRVGAEQDVHAVHAQDLEGGAADRPQHRLGVERLADALVEGGEGAGLLVVEPLRLQVPGALDGDAELAAHRLEEAQLGVLERRAGSGRHVQDAAARPVERERHAGVGHGLLETGGDHRHARALGGVAGLGSVARGEDLPAEALAEAPRPREVEVRGRDAAVGGETELAVLLVLEEDPGGGEAEAAQQRVERRVEDDLDVLLAVDARRDGRENGELPLATLHGPLEVAEARGDRGHGPVFRQVLRHRFHLGTTL